MTHSGLHLNHFESWYNCQTAFHFLPLKIKTSQAALEMWRIHRWLRTHCYNYPRRHLIFSVSFLQYKHMHSKVRVYSQIPGSCPSHHKPLAWPMSLDSLKGRSLQSEIVGLYLPGRKKDNADTLLTTVWTFRAWAHLWLLILLCPSALQHTKKGKKA